MRIYLMLEKGVFCSLSFFTLRKISILSLVCVLPILDIFCKTREHLNFTKKETKNGKLSLQYRLKAWKFSRS